MSLLQSPSLGILIRFCNCATYPGCNPGFLFWLYPHSRPTCQNRGIQAYTEFCAVGTRWFRSVASHFLLATRQTSTRPINLPYQPPSLNEGGKLTPEHSSSSRVPESLHPPSIVSSCLLPSHPRTSTTLSLRWGKGGTTNDGLLFGQIRAKYAGLGSRGSAWVAAWEL